MIVRTPVQLRARPAAASVAALVLSMLAVTSSARALAPAAAATQASSPTATVLTGTCLNPTVRLTVEEARLNSRLAKNGNPAVPQAQSFAHQMIDSAGFQHFGPGLVDELCGVTALQRARAIVQSSGKRLWRMAVDRAQRRAVQGTLPASDDRPVYWTRLQSEAAILQWMPRFVLSAGQRSALLTSFDKASRGMFSISFPPGKRVKRLIFSGFDPYTLDGGVRGRSPGVVANNIRHGNPSGALALALDGTTYRARDGKRVYIQSYVLPVDFPQFQQGYLENTVGPLMRPGPRQVGASVTVSQAGPNEFDLEQYNGRYHGTFPGNDDFEPCPLVGGGPQRALDNPQCNTMVVRRWGGPIGLHLSDPPQWTTTSLPIAQLIAAKTGAGVARPPGDGWSNRSVAFGVVWHTSYSEFPGCGSVSTVTRNTPVPTVYPPPTAPIPPDPGSCSYMGGGGNYLSNESAYRNTLLARRLGFRGFTGHIHTPDMQHFERGDRYNATDATFAAWRSAIIEQGTRLLHVIGDRAPDLP